MARFTGFVFMALWLSCGALAAEEGNSLIVADFDNAQSTNNLGKEIEIWLQGDGGDETQTCQMSFVKDDALGEERGHSLQLDYDVDSPNPAYNGMRTDLGNFDATGYKNLNFYVKGDAARGFGKRLKVELIGPDMRPSPYIFDGVTTEWQKVTIPLSEFWVVRDWTQLQKFVVVFADIVNDPKSGTVYLDHVHFSK